jgi:hypothetical protein
LSSFSLIFISFDFLLLHGEHTSLTRRNDGNIRLLFKNLQMDAGLNVEGYAITVCNKIIRALEGLVEE